MPFITGIISLNNCIEGSTKRRFEESLLSFMSDSPWPVERIDNDKYILVCADSPDMWEGPKTISGSDYDAIATGVQWKRISSFNSALEYLTAQFQSENPKIRNYFDYFSCAIIDKRKNRCILATDPLGIAQVVYYVDDSVLVFSSHQSFIRRYLGDNITICWDAVFEYLLIQHLIGNKTLIEGVKLLPPGYILELQGSDWNMAPYAKLGNIRINTQITVEEACQLLWDHLDEKFRHYESLTKKNFIGLLSGGWDTRLITSFLARTGRLRETFTTEQSVRLGDMYVVEEKIARDVANFIGVNNRFVRPSATRKRGERFYKLPRIVDYSTTYHKWSLSLAEALPQGECILTDGFLGDVLIRGTHIPDDLQRCVEEGNKEKASELTFAEYVSGVSHGSASDVYYPDAESWKRILDPQFISDSTEHLKQAIINEFQDIQCENFVTAYQLKNRQRRCISWLPTAIFGSAGAVILPFCDLKFVEIALAIPNEMKQNQLLYKCLLERTKSGLSEIPSTNTKDIEKLRPYLTRAYIGDMSALRLFSYIFPKKYLKRLYRIFMRTRVAALLYSLLYKRLGMASRIFENFLIADEIIRNPPTTFMNLLTPEIRDAIYARNRGKLAQYASYLRHILVLDKFFSNKF